MESRYVESTSGEVGQLSRLDDSWPSTLQAGPPPSSHLRPCSCPSASVISAGKVVLVKLSPSEYVACEEQYRRLVLLPFARCDVSIDMLPGPLGWIRVPDSEEKAIAMKKAPIPFLSCLQVLAVGYMYYSIKNCPTTFVHAESTPLQCLYAENAFQYQPSYITKTY